jgi:hypothetical protein
MAQMNKQSFSLFSFLIALFILPGINSSAQENHWQQQVDFKIGVALSDKDHSLTGTETIRYQNNSPDTLHYILFHLWPNAYKNDKTAFSEQLLADNRTDFYFSNENRKGYINQLRFTVDGTLATPVDDPVHQDIVKLMLPQPLLPGQKVSIESSFHVKLPSIFSRSGHRKDFYAVTQWYPKPAVYDKNGWHPMPYLDRGEFYSEFGDYEVQIKLPEGFVPAATGELTDSTIKDHSTTYTYRQDKIHDFAWFASKSFIVAMDTVVTASGKKVSLVSYQQGGNKKAWKNSLSFMKEAIRFRSNLIGDYPYDVMKVVDGYQGEGNGGMEYPTIIVINGIDNEHELEKTIAHEIGHNWFYAAIATNERRHPWLDEGLNTYYDNRYAHSDPDDQDHLKLLIRGLESLHLDQPIQTASDSFNMINYGLIAYQKAAWWLENMEKELGTPLFDSCMRRWYQQYSFRHADPTDFRRVFETVSGKKLSAFDLLEKTGPLQKQERKKLKPAFLYSNKQPDKYNYIGIGPLAGYNHYDGFMVGGFIHNYQLPVPAFRFFIAPLYATKSKTLTGLANLSYNLYSSGFWKKIEIGFNAARFTGYSSTVESVSRNFSYSKLVPNVKLVLNERNPLSKKERYVQFKSFFISEEKLSYHTIIVPPDTIPNFSRNSVGRNLQQLKFYWADHRILYPYEMNTVIDFNKDFTRIAFTGQYFINYPNRQGGLNARFFAGKFIYNTGRSFNKELELERYTLNMSGANGYEDYTYSNYFVGRNEFEGWESQQMMIRDGGFKVRTDLYSNKIGKTDNWLTALNLTADLPNKLNPLSLLPVKIPLKVFADFGTYAEAWEEDNTEGRVLFDAGFQISLFKEFLNIYIPIINSKPFRDYHQSTLGDNKFLKTISFSIDLQNINSRKILASFGG